MPKISVCIPTYNRPDTLRQLINSYLKQDIHEKELVISDDTQNDSIKKLIREYNNKSIKYFHNSPGLGFSQNLLKSIERATGDYIIILGDDDILLNPHVLSDYVKIFETKPTVGFIYSNIVQFSDKLKIEYVIDLFTKDRLFKKGKDSMEHMWTKSIFIGGIGIRNNKNLKKLYPSKKILHPQVEFIGNIINQYDAYSISKHHIGFRSHDDQIIFRALKNITIRQEGEHMTVELFTIFNQLNVKYNLHMDFEFAAQDLIRQQLVMMFKEKNNLGSKVMEMHYNKFRQISETANKSTKLKTAFILSKTFPSFAILLARNSALKLTALKNRTLFTTYKKQLMSMISD